MKSIQGVIESSERVTNQEAIKSAQTKLSLEFCVFTSALCETVLVLFGVVCQYSLLVMASKQQQVFRMCVHPCPRYLTGGDTHILCVACLGEENARSALESAGCEHCDVLPLRMLRSRLALFREGAQAHVPQGSGPATAEAQRRL